MRNFLIALFALAAVPAHAALVGHWKFQDNAASTTVVADVGSNATLVGGDNTATITDSGPGGSFTRSLHLDGTADYIALPNMSSAFGGNTAASLTLWVKLDNANPDWPQSGLCILGDGRPAGQLTHYPAGGGTSLGYFCPWRATNSTTLQRVGPITLPASVPRTNWHHLAFVSTPGASGWKLYIQGNVAATATGHATFYVGDSAWYIGDAKDGGGSTKFDGCICDVRLYDHALTQGEVSTIRADGITASQSIFGGDAVFDGLIIR